MSMRILSPKTDTEDEAMQRTQTILRFLPILIGWFSLNVPAALGLYWMTNNLVTTGTTVGLKNYFKANPPQFDVPEDVLNFKDEGELPTLEEALEEAKANPVLPRQSRRATMTVS